MYTVNKMCSFKPQYKVFKKCKNYLVINRHQIRKWHSFTIKKGVSSRLSCSISSYTHTWWTIMTDHSSGQTYRRRRKNKTVNLHDIQFIKSFFNAQTSNNKTIIININKILLYKNKREQLWRLFSSPF